MRLCWIALAPLAAATDSLIDLHHGQINGTMSGNITKWLGIPFAAKPLDQLRFAAPVDPPSMSGTLQANQSGPYCLQVQDPPGEKQTQQYDAEASEDCLVLFHPGGGFQKNDPARVDGSQLIRAADYEMVFVTANYRVGLYGFLPGIEVEAEGNLNAGLKDQVKALEWVQENIGFFGGNASHVVLGGVSAGAKSVAHHLTAYGGQNATHNTLFQAATAGEPFSPGIYTAADMDFVFQNLTDRANCSSAASKLACLRALPVDDLQRINQVMPHPNHTIPPDYIYAPVIDGALVPDSTYRLLAAGDFAHVPIITGDDANGGSTFFGNLSYSLNDFVSANYPRMTQADLDVMDALFTIDSVPHLLSPNNGTNALNWTFSPDYDRIAAAYGQLAGTVPSLLIADAFAKAGVKSWNYLYNASIPYDEELGVGVFHAQELAAVFGNGSVPGAPKQTDTVTEEMMGYWARFVTTLDPNGGKQGGEWEEWGQCEKRLVVEEQGSGMKALNVLDKGRYEWGVQVGQRIGQ